MESRAVTSLQRDGTRDLRSTSLMLPLCPQPVMAPVLCRLLQALQYLLHNTAIQFAGRQVVIAVF